MTRCRWIVASLFVGLVAILPSSAAAQAISGTVTDATGGVVPGVTVTITSPQMIEGTKTAVTSSAGRYQFLRLAVGTYSVTFALDGFTTVKQDNVVLRDNFEAPVNAKLVVGAMTEVVVVNASTPMVDVVNVANTTRIDAEMLDALPLGARFINDILLQIPGVEDAGAGTFSYRGSTDSYMTVDGNRTTYLNATLNAGAFSQGLAAGAYQEYSITTAIDSMDSGTGGLRINVVPKDGGNRVAGSVYGVYSGLNWSSNNVSQKLKDLGLTSSPVGGNGSGNGTNLDLNPSWGGPVIKNRVWYQNTFRYNKDDRIVHNAWDDQDPDPFVYNPDKSGEGKVFDNRTRFSLGTRINWQASAKDKIAGNIDDSMSWQPHRLEQGFTVLAADPAVQQYSSTPHQLNLGGRWTRTQTSRLLLEASGSRFYTIFGTRWRGDEANKWSPMNGGVDQGFVGPIPSPAAQSYSIGGLTGFGRTQNATTSSFSKSMTHTARAEATYVRGAHTMRFGASYFTGSEKTQTRRVGDVTYTLTDVTNPANPDIRIGVPQTINAFIPSSAESAVKADVGVWLQEQWTRQRLTLKGGLRYDYILTGFPDQYIPESIWLAEQNCAVSQIFCARNHINWKDISPRISAAYDLFGTGKTALKAGWARFVAGESVGTTNAANPVRNLDGITAGESATWTDLNNNKSVFDQTTGQFEWNEINRGTAFEGRFQTPTFGNTPAPAAIPAIEFDPAILNGWGSRRYTTELNLSVDHQILPRVTVGLTYYNRRHGNRTANDNRFYEFNDENWTRYCLIAPTHPDLPNGGGYPICDLYDITTIGQQRRDTVVNVGDRPRTYQTFEKNLQTRIRKDNGYDVSVNARLPQGAFLQGGFDYRQNVDNDCDFIDVPRQFCDREGAFNLQPRFSGSYTLREWSKLGFINRITKGMSVSAIYRGRRGPNVAASWTACGVTNTTDCLGTATDLDLAKGKVDKELGRLFTVDTTLGTTGRRTISLIQPNSKYLPYIHTVDARFSKRISMGRYQVTLGGDLYNMFNSGAVTSINGVYGGTNQVAARTWQQPTALLGPRTFRLSGNMSF